MTVRVLGPLDVGAPQLSPRERSVLSALVLRVGTSIEPGELAEALWGDEAPATWRQQVKTSVARIRTRLGRDAVITSGSLYALGLDPDAIDAVRFERLVSTARQHALHGDADRAIDAYERALGLWRGQPYADLTTWDPGVVEAMRLTEIRTSAEEELLQSRLAAGMHRAVIPDAERLTRENPLREDRWAILALANYRSGRQGAALATIREARRRLMDDLGIDVGDRLRELETAILRQDPTLAPEVVLWEVDADCPYPGLSAFDAEDADLFFGRDAEIDALLERIVPGAIVAIAGPSGSGKSSLLRAGILPRLRGGGREIPVIRPGEDGIDALRRAMERGATIVALDQTEELMQASEGTVEEFCEHASQLLANGGTVVLTIRSDFLDDATRLPLVGPLLGRGVFVLAPLTPEGLRAAVAEPARSSRLRLEPGLVEVVLRDAADRLTTLPYVSHALRETWVRREGATLTVQGYEDSGGIAGAIAQSAETVFRSVDVEDQRVCRSVLLRLVARDGDGTTLRRRVAAGPLRESPARRRIVDALVAARLVTADGDAIIIAHEAVATAWPRLDGWLEEDALGARLMTALSAASESWDADGRPDDALLRGARLHATLDWRDTAHPDLTAREAEFLALSEAREVGEREESDRRAAAERRQNRRLRGALAGAAALLVVALALGGVATIRSSEAQAAALDARIEALTSRATVLRETDRDMAALVAAEAYRRWPDDPRTRSALFGSVVEAAHYLGSTPIIDATERLGLWPIPGTTTVATVRELVTLEVRDYRTGEVVRTIDDDLPRSDQSIRPWVRVSEDGSTIGILQHFGRQEGVPDSELMLFYDVATGQRVGPAVSVEDSLAESLSLSPDGRWATWASQGEVVIVERGTDLVRRHPLRKEIVSTQQRAVGTSAFGPDGLIYAGIDDGRLYTIDPNTLEELRVVASRPGFVDGALTVAASGAVFAIGLDGAIAFDAEGRTMWDRSFERYWECSRIAASSVADLAVCGDESGTVQQWQLSTGDLVAEPFDFQMSAPGDLAFVDGDAELLLMSAIAPVIGRLAADGSGAGAEAFATGQLMQQRTGQLDPSSTRLIVENRATAVADLDEQRSYAVWDLATDEGVFRIPDDIADPLQGELWEPRWWTEDTLLAWEVRRSADENGEPAFEDDAVLIDVATGAITRDVLPVDTYDTMSVAEQVFTLSETGVVRRIDPETLGWTGPAMQLPIESPPFHVAAASDGSRVLVTQWDGRVFNYLYDGETGELIAETEARDHTAWIAPDGDIFTADNVQVYRRSPETLEVTGTVAHLAGAAMLAGAGDVMIARGGRGAVGVVDVATLRPHSDLVPADNFGGAVITPDAMSLIVPTWRGMAVWSLDPDDHFAAACRIAGRDMTDAEWATHLAELGEPVPTCADALS
ncbi:BTAD domain-containing putative transcriptional regulator [Microbacterium sp. 2FI]|uniref:nSTAND1 domain-containing NTPase n=1 Tax=Microbacterium sp. 2FI TaxID=2502193 RepID=UPI0010F5E154|nr:BTAD domain-containing putative transcriptional regulator [Microbacterium sp. 2FI]